MLRNSAGLATSHVSKANGVEQRGLTVIDMAHDGDDWRTRASFRRSSFACGGGIRNFFRRVLFECDYVCLSAKETRHFDGEFRIKVLIDGGKCTAGKQTRDQILRADFEFLRQIFDADALGDGDAASDRRGSLESDIRGGGV